MVKYSHMFLLEETKVKMINNKKRSLKAAQKS